MPRRPRQAPRHTRRRLQLRHVAPCARSSLPILLLLERRNPPPSPGSLASELASHNPSADCFLFDPDAFKSWRPIHSLCSHTAAQLATRICKLQFDLTSLRHILRSYDFVTAATCIHVDTDFKANQAALHQSCGAVIIRHFSAPRVRITPRHIRHFEYHRSGSQPTATRPDLTRGRCHNPWTKWD